MSKPKNPLAPRGPYQHESDAAGIVEEARRKGKRMTMEQAYNDACYSEPAKPRAKRGKGGGK